MLCGDREAWHGVGGGRGFKREGTYVPMGVPVDVWRSQHNTAKQLSSNKKLDKKPRGNIVTSSVKALRKGLKEDVLPLQTGGDAQTEEPPGLSPLAQFMEP